MALDALSVDVVWHPDPVPCAPPARESPLQMTRLMDFALLLVPGIALLAATWLTFHRFRPRNGVIHPAMKSDLNCNLVLFAFVSGTALGITMIISGLADIIRPH